MTSWMTSMRTSHRGDAITPDALINDLVPFAAIGDALAQAIVDTVREPLLVLDRELPSSPAAAPSTRPSRPSARKRRASFSTTWATASGTFRR
jgi:hypothetical protein